MENILEPKVINELLGFSFYVDSYQRGYRWGTIEVKALLNDITEFAKKDKTNDEAYWLQPIIVKEVEKEVNGNTIICYELIDGQQRLTTIFLILKVLNENSNFQIHYNTRTSSTAFLHDIDNLTNFETWDIYKKTNAENDKIDNFYFFTAFKIIQNRFKNETAKNKDRFKNALLKQTNVIWYELVGSDDMLPKTVFEQINIGKIPLTNAELVKALYLNTTIDKIKRDEIAQKWDRIEYALNDKKLWAFISNDIDKEHNRIEYLLDLISGKFNSNKNKEEKLHTFLYFNKATDKIEAWEKVESYFQTLLGWFETPDLYHYAGFLIARNFYTINELITKYYSLPEQPKSKFKDELVSIITEELSTYDIESLTYEKHADKIHTILLLFNIQTVLITTPFNYFPFEEYKKEKSWSLEHIYAQQSEKLTKPEAIRAWIMETKTIVEGFREDAVRKEEAVSLCAAFEEALLLNENIKLGELPAMVYNFFGGDNEGMDLLSNMALLDKDTNSSLNNSVFPVKRKKIFKAETQKKKFIPICTKNVFLKYYSADIRHVQFWGKQDSSDYLNEILNCLKPFNVGGQQNG
jgi:uncharacterized protein with ParB-like and HNH nuclease domain